MNERDERAFAPTVMPEAPTRRLDERGSAGRRGAKRKLFRVGAIGLIALAILAAAFGRQGGHQPGGAGSGGPQSAPGAVTLATTLSGRDMSLRVPAGWRRVDPAGLGLPLRRPVAATASRGASAPVVEFGLVKGAAASNNALLPATLLDAVGSTADSPPARKPVRLPAQSLQAWRYGGLRPVGTSRELTVYAVPTSAGVATVVCAVPPASAGALAGACDAIAGSLELKRATPYPIGASNSYASALNVVIGNLDQVTKAQEAGLQSAQTLAGQGAAAEALARSYSKAAGALARLRLSPADSAGNAQLVAALRGAAAAYRKAARAARAGNPDAYRAASAAIPAATAAVNSALANVRAGGYGGGGQGASTGAGSGAQAGAGSGAQAGAGSGAQAGGGGSSGSEEAGGDGESSGPGSDVGDSRSDDPSDDSADP